MEKPGFLCRVVKVRLENVVLRSVLTSAKGLFFSREDMILCLDDEHRFCGQRLEEMNTFTL